MSVLISLSIPLFRADSELENVTNGPFTQASEKSSRSLMTVVHAGSTICLG